MPTSPQITTRNKKTDYGKGSADSALMGSLYRGSTATDPSMVPILVEAKANMKLLMGTVKDGFMFDSYDRDFGGEGGAPNYEEFKDAVGAPASAWVPNPMSPGEGNGDDPTKKVAAPDGYGTKHSAGAYAGGPNLDPALAANKPSVKSKKMSNHTTFSYTMGKSKASE
jgi:hypothetical protein